MIVSSLTDTLDRSPKDQNTAVPSAVSLAKYCRMVVPAVNIEPTATPARTMDGGEKLVL